MSDRTARMACVISLVPLAFGVFFTCLMGLKNVSSINAEQVGALAGTLVTFAVVIAVWRTFVRWRAVWWLYLTGSTAVVVGHAVVWASLLAPIGNCDSTPEIMRASQSLVLLASWCVGFSLVAWGSLLRRRARRGRPPTMNGGRLMSPNIARLAIALALLPFSVGFLYGYGLVDERLTGATGDVAMCRAGVLTALVVAAIWLSLWRRQVAWTHRRVAVTAVLAAVLVLSPLLILLRDGSKLFSYPVLADLWDIGRYISPVYALALFIAGSAWVWREKGELRGRIVIEGLDPTQLASCPQCRYSLRGLREVRCPECGWSATVDELVARICTELTDA